MNKKKYFMGFLFLFLILFSICFCYGCKSEFVNAKSENNVNLIQITQDELKEKIQDRESLLVYIGRPSCPDCKKFQPILEDTLNKYNSKIYYYNTESKASEKKAIKEFLQTLNISSIPQIVDIQKGEVKTLFDGQNENDIEKFKIVLKGE